MIDRQEFFDTDLKLAERRTKATIVVSERPAYTKQPAAVPSV